VVFLSMAIDKNAVIKDAQKYVAKGQFDKAIAEWKKLLRDSPSDPNIYNTIGDLCLKKEAKNEAVDAYRKAADILAEDGFTSKAIALYKKVLNIDPQKIDIYLALGNLNAEKGLVGAALENYKLIADHYTQQKDMVKALGIYQKMADLNPSNVAFRIKLGDMYAKDGMKTEAANAYLAAADAQVAKSAFQEARLLFEKVLSLDPGNTAVYHKAGLVYFKEGKFIEACKALKPAFEHDPGNRELADIYLEALSKTDKTVEREEVLITLITADAGRIELREQLYHLYLSNQEYEKALREASALALARTENNENEAAEDVLKSFVAKSPGFAPGQEKLAEFYASTNRPDEAAQELLLAAGLYEEAGDQPQYKAMLVRALEIVPDMPEASKLLARLESSASTHPQPAPAAAAPAAPEIAPEISTVVSPGLEMPLSPSPDAQPVEEEPPAIDEAFTEADVLMKYGLPAKAAEQLEGVAAQYPENLRVHARLKDIYRELRNIEKAVRQSLLLSDIHAKQGRTDMADTELRSAQEIDPGNPVILARLGLAPAAPAPVEPSPPDITLDHLNIAAEVPPIPPSTFEEAPSILEPVSAGDGRILFEGLDTSPPVEDGGHTHQETDQQLPPPVDISLTGEQQSPQELLDESTPLSEETPDNQPSRVAGVTIPQEEAAIPETFAAFQPPSPASAGTRETADEVDLNEIWAEAEFYYQQGLFDEARKHYAKIISVAPSDRRAIDRLAEISREEDETKEFTRLAEAVESLEDDVVPGGDERALATSASDEDAVRRLMKEIAEVSKKQPAPSTPSKTIPPQPPRPVQAKEAMHAGEKERKPTPEPPRRQEPPRKSEPIRVPEPAGAKPAPAQKPAGDDYFDLGLELQKEIAAASAGQERKKKTDNFFDLAVELRSDARTTVPAGRSTPTQEDQSLDDIFEEFKKGVELQTTKEDTDTHYNLGVAYKEMGLLDDAIAEFILTPEGEPWFIQSRYMLGLCYLEKGNYQSAITELRNALSYSQTYEIDDQERSGIQYDLGLAYQSAGNIKAAIAEFQKVADRDPRYRDIGEKLKELKQGDFISLEQLKDDIEKEISAKFLQEGERIQSEERSKKTIKSGIDRA
jgi:pilus assembly protein FimV